MDGIDQSNHLGSIVYRAKCLVPEQVVPFLNQESSGAEASF